MPKIKISKRSVDALQPDNKPFVAYDEDLTGLGVRIMPSGSKTYIVEYRPGSGGHRVRSVRLSLGRHGVRRLTRHEKLLETNSQMHGAARTRPQNAGPSAPR
jgi:hypothetical protein